MIRCATCGAENQLGHLYCTSCRTKLDMDAMCGEADDEMAGSPRLARVFLIVLAVLAVLLALSGLALWPAIPARASTQVDAQVQQAVRKLMLLAPTNATAPQAFSEAEVSAYLAVIMSRNRPAIPVNAWLITQTAAATITRDAVVLTTVSSWKSVRFGTHRFGPYPFSSALTVAPVVTDRGTTFVIKRGRVGHLPLPGPLATRVCQDLLRALQGLKLERSIVESAKRFDLEDGKVTIGRMK